MWNEIECPCYRCPDRKVGCHSDCKRYNGWRKAVRRANKRRQEIERQERFAYSERHKYK